MNADLLARFQRLFRGRETAHGLMVFDAAGQKVRATTEREPAPDVAWERHLRGESPGLGIVPLRLDGMCYFAAIDIDDVVDTAAIAVQVAATPLVVCRSKGGGAHLYVFGREPIPAARVVAAMKRWQRDFKMLKNADGRLVELFPKQLRLKPAEPGNWINLPYYGVDDSLRYGVDATGARLSFAAFVDYAEARRVTAAQLAAVATPGARPFTDGPVCLEEQVHHGVGPGERNGALFNAAVYLKLKHPDDWTERLEAFNAEHVDPSLPAAEIAAVMKSIGARDYAYQCDRCTTTCKRRRYGAVAAAKQQALAEMPDLSTMVKIETDPPRYRLRVGTVTIEVTSGELLNQGQFQRVVFERADVLLPPLRQNEWHDMIRTLMTTCKKVIAPSDAGVAGQFRALAMTWLELRSRATLGLEDLLRDLPVEHDGYVYLFGTSLYGFLKERRFVDYPIGQVYTALEKMFGADHQHLTIRGGQHEVWRIPVPALTSREQTEPFTVAAPTPEF